MKGEKKMWFLPRGVLAGAAWALVWLLEICCTWNPVDDALMFSIIPVCAAILIGVILSGEQMGRAWLVSVPAGWAAVFVLSDMPQQIFDQQFPDCGRMSAGMGVGFMLVSAAYCGITLLGGPVVGWLATEARRAWAKRRTGGEVPE